MEEKTTHETSTATRGRIIVSLWPEGYRKQGQLTSVDDLTQCSNPMVLDIEIDAAELLQKEWSRSCYQFEQEGALSIQRALREHEAFVTMEDIANAQD